MGPHVDQTFCLFAHALLRWWSWGPVRAGPTLPPPANPMLVSAPGTVPTSVHSREPVPREDDPIPLLSMQGFCPFSLWLGCWGKRGPYLLPPSLPLLWSNSLLPSPLTSNSPTCFLFPPERPAWFSYQCLLIPQGLFHVLDPPRNSEAHPPNHYHHSTLLFPEPSESE